MKQLLLVFGILLATLTLVSAMGGGLRQREGFFEYSEDAMAAADAAADAQVPVAQPASEPEKVKEEEGKAVAVGPPTDPVANGLPPVVVNPPSAPAPSAPAGPEAFVIEPFEGQMYAGCGMGSCSL